MRLSPAQWLVVVVVIVGVFLVTPRIWRQIEPFQPAADYRLPYRLGHDYWMAERCCAQAAADNRTLLIGDSVIWGHYVSPDETLSHHLNVLSGGTKFANLGVDGIHPAALAGLIEHYGTAIAERDVVLHCNFLWMTSPQHDLRTDKEFSFNHPELVPQFYPRLPCYRESFSNRLGIVVDRHVSFFRWVRHLRMAYFNNAPLPQWTIDNPYGNPISQITLELPPPDEPPSPAPVARPWREKQLGQFTPDWVELETSLQWRFFRDVVRLLQRRGNRVFVVIGPFNEHMLTPEGLRGYRRAAAAAHAWLVANGVPCLAPEVLPSDLYADASHPLAEGYRSLAHRLLADAEFREFAEAPQGRQ